MRFFSESLGTYLNYSREETDGKIFAPMFTINHPLVSRPLRDFLHVLIGLCGPGFGRTRAEASDERIASFYGRSLRLTRRRLKEAAALDLIERYLLPVPSFHLKWTIDWGTDQDGNVRPYAYPSDELFERLVALKPDAEFAAPGLPFQIFYSLMGWRSA
jgi:hypothetical protein